MDVTLKPQCFKIVPSEDAMTPLPIPDITPPVTKMYFILSRNEYETPTILRPGSRNHKYKITSTLMPNNYPKLIQIYKL